MAPRKGKAPASQLPLPAYAPLQGMPGPSQSVPDLHMMETTPPGTRFGNLTLVEDQATTAGSSPSVQNLPLLHHPQPGSRAGAPILAAEDVDMGDGQGSSSGNNNDGNQAKKKKSTWIPFGSSKEKKNKDGQTPKKRGPKPDARPAKNRRQALNRQAQRTHRERKEVYLKSLEAEIRRLRDSSNENGKRMDIVNNENDRFKQLLHVNRITIPFTLAPRQEFIPLPPSTEPMDSSAGPSSGSNADGMVESGTVREGFEAPDTPSTLNYGLANTPVTMAPMGLPLGPLPGAALQPPSGLPGSPFGPPPGPPASNMMPIHPSPTAAGTAPEPVNRMAYWINPPANDQPFLGEEGTRQGTSARVQTSTFIDHDQVGVDFILALEKNCHDHKTLMASRTFDDSNEVGGHALMLTNPPEEHFINSPGVQYPHQLPEGTNAGLLNLMNLSSHLPHVQDGELTPVAALAIIRGDPRYKYLNTADFKNLTLELKDRCRCYGWGAVIEAFEVNDVMDDIYTSKPETRDLPTTTGLHLRR